MLNIGNINYAAAFNANDMLVRQRIPIKLNGLASYVQTPDFTRIRHMVKVAVDGPFSDVWKRLPGLFKHLLNRHVSTARG